MVFVAAKGLRAADSRVSDAPTTFRQYCFQCHGKAAVAGLNLEQLTSHSRPGEQFQHWQKVAAALEQKRMPPKKMPQPSDGERSGRSLWVRARLNGFRAKNAGDPGASPCEG